METMKMKVLLLIDAWFPFVGGAQIQIKNLSRILKDKHNVNYFILHAPSANILIRLFWSLWVIPQAIYLYKKEKFDLIHAHAYWPAIPGKILAKILKLPFVFTAHGSNLLDLRKKGIRPFLEKYILTKIEYDWLISVSSNFLKYKNINKKITIIPNGADIKKFKSLKVKKLKSKSPITNHQPPTILFVGRLEKIKGVDYLIKAFKKVVNKFKSVNLVIAGKGSEEMRLKKLAKNLNVNHKIKFVFYKNYNDLIVEYSKADVFVLPSLSEGQPLTLLEAWAAKLPVVVTNVGENPKMVKNGINGYLVEIKNSESLAKAIIKVLKNKNRNLMGEKGYQLVKEKYSWQNCAKKTYEIYKKAIKN